MRLVPKAKSTKIAFFRSRIEKWADDPAAIGCDAETIALLAAALEKAQAADRAQRELEQARRSATARLNTALAELSKIGGRVIAKVRTHSIYGGTAPLVAAYLPVRRKWSRVGPPGKPGSIKHELLSDGSVRLRWKCKQPRGVGGTTYNISRCDYSPAGSRQFKLLGTVGERTFHDLTVPPGTSIVTYRIQARRTRQTSLFAEHNVNYGGGFEPRFQTKTKKVVALVSDASRAAA